MRNFLFRHRAEKLRAAAAARSMTPALHANMVRQIEHRCEDVVNMTGEAFSAHPCGSVMMKKRCKLSKPRLPLAAGSGRGTRTADSFLI
jgi:hypothetical protein